MGEFLIEVFWELVLKPSLEFLFHKAWKHLVVRPFRSWCSGRCSGAWRAVGSAGSWNGSVAAARTRLSRSTEGGGHHAYSTARRGIAGVA